MRVPECIELVRAGTLRPLAVTTATRSPVLPNLPAIGDFLPGYGLRVRPAISQNSSPTKKWAKVVKFAGVKAE